MRNLTEIIPPNMPLWMKEAMEDEQLFTRVVERFYMMEAELEEANKRPNKENERFGHKVTLIIIFALLAYAGFSLFEPYLSTVCEVVQVPGDHVQS